MLAEDSTGENLRRGAVEAVAIIADRVQHRGEGSDGQRLVTKSSKRLGAYEKSYALQRIKAGRQTAIMDLTKDGDLFRSWNVLTNEPTMATAGFMSNKEADIAEYIEDYHGPIFNLSSSEQDFVVEGITERLLDDLSQRLYRALLMPSIQS